MREFTTALAAELPVALREMVGGFIAAVDLDQAVIGPGMAIFSRYTRVIEPNTGESMTVGRALQLISEAVGTFFGGIVGSLDRDTQFCVKWFELHGLDVGKYPEAEQLATVRNLVVDTLADHQLLESKHGSVRLYGVDDYIHRYVSHDPATDQHSSVWQACHYLAAALIDKDGGEAAAARIARRLGGLAHDAVALAYHLFAVCNAPNSKWSREGQAYNALTDAWPAIQVAMAEVAREERQQQGRLV
ncbi:MAG: hypothetical protein EPO65_12360 [Dehalococcoidia bacterium]|nr:MAG: hypothetical protein EPO65_12360 [Dehalococcoidia bacterium]